MSQVRRFLYKGKLLLFSIIRLPYFVDSLLSRCLFYFRPPQGERKTEANHTFFKRQFVAHGRFYSDYPENSMSLFMTLVNDGFTILECDVMFTKDNIPVLCHDNNIYKYALDRKGNKVNRNISQMTYEELSKYNFSKQENCFIPITKLEDLLSFCQKRRVCLEIDLEKRYLGRRRYRLLYNLVKNYNLTQSVIWEVLPLDFYSALLLDRSLIFQINHSWSIESIERFSKYKNKTSLIILSKWFANPVNSVDSFIINQGHQAGFLMKCATINDIREAKTLFASSVDLITTDSLNNNML